MSIAVTQQAFAAIRADGSVVTWGSSGYGGDSSSVASSLNGLNPVTSVVAGEFAFAAIRADGSVITWGNSAYGGDKSKMSSRIEFGVTSIVPASGLGFAAVLDTGAVVAWGSSDASTFGPHLMP